MVVLSNCMELTAEPFAWWALATLPYLGGVGGGCLAVWGWPWEPCVFGTVSAAMLTAACALGLKKQGLQRGFFFFQKQAAGF